MPIPTGAASRLAFGASLPWRGASYLARNPKLWRYAVFPVLLTLIGLVVGIWALWPLSAALLGALWPEPTGTLFALWALTQVVLFGVMLVGTALTLPVVAGAPFSDRLSARVEAMELGEQEAAGGFRQLASELWVSVWHAAVRLTLLLFGQGALLLLLLVPGLAPAYPVLAFLYGAVWLTFEYVDLPMARHLYRFREVRAALRAVRPAGLGFGAMLGVFFLVPLANLIFVPVGAVAGTLLYCEIKRSGLLPARQESGQTPGPP
jgi:CysZ protein